MKHNTTIRNCNAKVTIRKQCPLTWESLQELGSPTVKMCSVCQRQVFFCASDEETMMHAEQGHCIARQIPDSSMLPVIALGEPEVVHIPTHEEEESLHFYIRERNITSALNNINHTQRRCTNCGYPVPKWWKQCRVCSGQEHRNVEVTD